MRLIAAGRASEVFDLGGGRVLRRFKDGGNPSREAEVMRHARAHAFPAPRVLEIRDAELVLEHVEGPTMLADLRRRPWRALRHARSLARLQARLHEIPFEGGRLVHLDLHPDNVLLSPDGPIVIDWTNARAGDPALDVALTWIIGSTSAGLPGRVFSRLFLRHVDRDAARRALGDAAEYRLADASVTDGERSRVRAFISLAGRKQAG